MQKSAVEETKIQTALNKQINDQTTKIAAAELKLITLENMLKNMQSGSTPQNTMPPQTTTTTKPMPTITTRTSTTTGPAPTAPTALLNQLKSQLQTLESEVKQLEQTHTKQITDLTQKTDKIKTDLANQTKEIAAAKSTAQTSFARLQVTEQDVQDAVNNLTQFQKRVNPEMSILQAEILETSKNVSTVISSLQQLGTSIMSDKIKIVKNTNDIKKLIPGAAKINNDLQKLNMTVSANLFTIDQEGRVLLKMLYLIYCHTYVKDFKYFQNQKHLGLCS